MPLPLRGYAPEEDTPQGFEAKTCIVYACRTETYDLYDKVQAAEYDKLMQRVLNGSLLVGSRHQNVVGDGTPGNPARLLTNVSWYASYEVDTHTSALEHVFLHRPAYCLAVDTRCFPRAAFGRFAAAAIT